MVIYKGVSKSFRTEPITKYTLPFGITRWEETQRVMAAKLIKLIHKIAIQLHLVAKSGGQSGNFCNTPSYSRHDSAAHIFLTQTLHCTKIYFLAFHLIQIHITVLRVHTLFSHELYSLRYIYVAVALPTCTWPPRSTPVHPCHTWGLQSRPEQ
jgi:hypothetical protein